MTIQPLNPNLILASQHAQDQLRQLEEEKIKLLDLIEAMYCDQMTLAPNIRNQALTEEAENILTANGR